MRPRYASGRKRAEFTPEERAFVLELLREGQQTCNPVYASSAAGFWLEHLVRPEFPRLELRHN